MYPFHMPGHKRNIEGTPMKGAFRCDITEIDNFDNLHDAKGVLLEAQRRANELYGADETFFLVNGSTSGVLSALSAVAGEGESILAARGSHKSFYHAAYLRKLNIKYLPYKQDSEYGIPEGYEVGDIEPLISDDIKAVFITSPTYEGKCSDIRGIAEACHRHGIPLIVDAAHGAHFLPGQDKCIEKMHADNAEKYKNNDYEMHVDYVQPYESDVNNARVDKEQFINGARTGKEDSEGMYESLPENAVAQGADIVIHSVHKTLPSMTQTALLHVQGELVDRERLKRFLKIYQSSSPSYILMASIDLCIEEMRTNRKEFIEKLLKYRNKIQKETADCEHLDVPGKDVIADAAKVLISVKNATMTGQELYDILREEYKLQLEMAGDDYVLAIITGWDKEEGIDRLIKAVKDIDATTKACVDKLSNETSSAMCRSSVMELPDKKMSLSEAWDADREMVDLHDAGGRIAGEFVNLYPPGIPIVVPGEVFSKGVIAKIDCFLKDGLNVQGIDNRKEVICVRQK